MDDRVLRLLAGVAMLAATPACIDWNALYVDAGVQDADAAVDVNVGCADGSREALAAFTDLAACNGAWLVGGVIEPEAPSCDRQAGNDGAMAAGTGCNVSDLCQVGWHVCNNRDDVAAHDGDDACAQLAGTFQAFFVTRQSGNATTCAGTGDVLYNDVYGCGSLGKAVTGCGPLNRKLGVSYCDVDFFDCGTDPDAEGMYMAKIDPNGGGGALCCRD